MLDIGTNCEPLDLPKAIDAVGRAYKAGGLEPPKFHFVAGSPISGSIGGVCLQRFFRGLENDLREPKILDRPFLDEAAKILATLPGELLTYGKLLTAPLADSGRDLSPELKKVMAMKTGPGKTLTSDFVGVTGILKRLGLVLVTGLSKSGAGLVAGLRSSAAVANELATAALSFAESSTILADQLAVSYETSQQLAVIPGSSSTSEVGLIMQDLLDRVPTIPTLQEYVDKIHIAHVNNGGTLPLKLPDVATDMANQLAMLLVYAITEGNNDGVPAGQPKLPAKSSELPDKMAPLGKTNGLRYLSLLGTLSKAVVEKLGSTPDGKALALKLIQEPGGLFLLIHRRLRQALHVWLIEKIDAIKKKDIPKEIDEEFARGCQQQFSDQANGNHDTSWSCYYDFLLNVCGVKEVEPLKGLLDLAQSCGWWTPLRWVAILQHRPAELHCDSEGRLHPLQVAHKTGVT